MFFCRNLLEYFNVTAGEHDLRIRENSEQTLPVKYVIKHPKFDPRRPMNYDIALLKLDGAFIFSKARVIYNLFPMGKVRLLLPTSDGSLDHDTAKIKLMARSGLKLVVLLAFFSFPKHYNMEAQINCLMPDLFLRCHKNS